MNKEYKFYSTKAFIKDGFRLINNNEYFVISTKTLFYLENHITNLTISKLFEILKKYTNYDLIIYRQDMIKKYLNLCGDIYAPIHELEELACAMYYDIEIHPDETIYITDSYTMTIIANVFLGEDSIKLI